ncbi:MAG: ATP-binding protein [Saprospiraceae bacterium]
MIQRLITSTLLEYLQHFPAVGLIGARQVGKTTLAKSLSTQFSNPVRYFDLERLEDFQLLSGDPGFFLSQYENDCVIIDEVQRLPALFSELRALIDQKRTNGRFLLLGSAAPLLMKQSADSLAGRIAYLTMHPFHLLEIGDAQTDIRNHWWRGGFPDAWLAENDAWSMTWREQFIRTYVERDLPFLGLRTDPVRFSIFLQMLASVNGQLWNAESIGRSLGTSGNTVKTYLDFLESSFFVHVLRPYFANPGKRLVKSPKVYIRDTGILHALTGVSRPEDLPVFAQAGNSWEGYVIGQILQILPSGLHPYFYRTADGTECDLILVRGLEPVACIEIKLGTVVNASRNFRTCIADLGTRHNFIINYASEAYQLTENITVVGLLGFLRGNYLQ